MARRVERNRKRKSAADSSKKIGYAVVGLGHIAQAAVLPAFKHASRNSRLVALVSGDEKKRSQLARRYGVEKTYSYEQYEECVASSEVDAVYIALPNTMHAEFTIRAARAGTHVLCEKPLATSEQQCREMIRACEESGVRLMTAYRLHFEPSNLEAMKLVKSGRLGEPKMFDSVFSFQVREGNIRLQKHLGGGPLWDIGIYCINAARHFFRSEPNRVFAWEARSDDKRFVEVAETVSALLRFPQPRLAAFSVSFRAAPVSTYRMVGTRGDLRSENCYEYKGDIEQTITIDEKQRQRRFPKGDQFGPEILYFSECILRGREPQPSGYEGLADVRVIEALHRSIDSGAPVDLEPPPRAPQTTDEREIRQPTVEEPPLVNAEPPFQD